MLKLRHLLFWLVLTLCPLGTPLLHGQTLPTHEGKKTDKAQMLQIWKALMAYKEAKGKFPDFLSDLVPDFLPDKEVLVSPADKNTKRKVSTPFDDPKLPCSYMYAFSATQVPPEGRTIREIMEAQLEEYGPVTPILRCFSGGMSMTGLTLNVTYSGDFFESQQMWETSPEATELIKKLGIGPGLKEGLFTQLTVVDENSTPVSGAEVKLTKRRSELAFPNRTLKTNENGIVKIPLARREAEEHQATISVSKPGYFATSERWSRNDYKEERRITLSPAAEVGGIVKLKDGSSLPEAEVLIKAMLSKPGEEKKSEHVIAQVKADAEGRWKCDGVPKNFDALKLTVKHSAIRSTEFDSAAESTPANREALLAHSAELLVSPAPVVRGEVIGSDGNPIRNAEVFLRPLVLKSISNNENNNNEENGEEQQELRNAVTRPPEPPLKTSPQGGFSIPWPDEAQVLVTVFAEGHAPAQQVITPTADAAPLKLTLEKGRAASGTLSDYEGKPVSGASVYLLMLGQNGVPGHRKIATTDNEGRFTWDTAPTQHFTLLFTGDGYSGALKDITSPGPVQTAVKIGKTAKEEP